MSERPRAIRILIVDDHALFREGLARLLSAEPDFETAALCASAEEGLEVLASGRVDVVLLDADLGNERGSDFLVRARESGFEGPVLVVTAGLGDGEASRLIAEGAAGIFFKEDSPVLLSKSIRAVMDGEAWIDQRYLATLVSSRRVPEPARRKAALTERERNVLRGVFEGLSNKDLATRLRISESSVKAALQQLFHKTGVRTRGQLVRIALEQYREEL